MAGSRPVIADCLKQYGRKLELRSDFNFRMPSTARVWRWEQSIYDFCAKHFQVRDFSPQMVSPRLAPHGCFKICLEGQ